MSISPAPPAAGRQPTNPPLVLSVGYEGRGIGDLIHLLHAWGVLRLVDVRELPLSRRVEFRKDALCRSLVDAGIEYLHVREAGNPFRKMKAGTDACLRAYRGHLQKTPFVINLLETLLGSNPVALLCYERQHEHCHRSVLLHALEESGVSMRVVTIS
jgi:uncharacterized protein (DUF488 family)